MLVRSTGLGKTVMLAEISRAEVAKENPLTLAAEKGQPNRFVMRLETSKPAHWYISTFLSPEDVRKLAAMILKPSVLFGLLSFLLSKSSDSEVESPIPVEENAELRF